MKKSVYKLRVPDELAEMIRGMHPHLKKKVRFSLHQMLNDPYSGKMLKDELSGLLSFRAGNFRMIYRISKKRVIEIVAIGPRKYIYEETFRIIQRDDLK